MAGNLNTVYYQIDGNYPPVLKSVVESYLSYFANAFYSETPINERLKRIILANIQNGSDNASRYNVDQFKQTNLVYPFTGYNIGEQELDTLRVNHFGASGSYFSQDMGMYISTINMTVEVFMVSFFSNAFDYFRFRTKLVIDKQLLTRLFVPIKINGRIFKTSFNANVEDIVKGSYSFEFEEYLRVNKIFDVVHSVKIDYQEIVANTAKQTELTIYPVDEIIFEMIDPVSGETFNTPTNFTIPKILSLNPIDRSTTVNINSTIEINFNIPMQDKDIYESITINPEIEYSYSFDTAMQILTITPTNLLVSGRLYDINILSTICAENGVALQGSTTYSFTVA